MRRLSLLLVMVAACGGSESGEPASRQAERANAAPAPPAVETARAAAPAASVEAAPAPPDDGPGVGIGDLAPPFSLPDDSGEEISLDQYRDQRAVLLAFYPKDFTGG